MVNIQYTILHHYSGADLVGFSRGGRRIIKKKFDDLFFKVDQISDDQIIVFYYSL